MTIVITITVNINTGEKTQIEGLVTRSLDEIANGYLVNGFSMMVRKDHVEFGTVMNGKRIGILLYEVNAVPFHNRPIFLKAIEE